MVGSTQPGSRYCDYLVTWTGIDGTIRIRCVFEGVQETMPLNGLIKLVTHLADRSDKGDEDVAALLEHMSELSAHICRVWQVNIDGLETLGLEAKSYQRHRENQPFDEFLSSKGVSVTQIAQARRANTAESYDLREIEKRFREKNNGNPVTSSQYAESLLEIEVFLSLHLR